VLSLLLNLDLNETISGEFMSDFIDAIVNMVEKDALEIGESRLDNGDDPLDILDECRQAMMVIGEKFERGESFIPELMMSGEILGQITEMVKPYLVGEAELQRIGRVVIGTVKGDIHDIAKDIVVFMLEVNGFEVFDLGVDVPPEDFVTKVKEVDASILGLSGFLTLAFEPMKETVEALINSGLRGKVKVMIGGGPVDQQACNYTGADAWGKDAMEAVHLARKWSGI
jgi:methanogenic corrinoid protein MtbC1